MSDFNRLICTDFDGVLHSYLTTWEDNDIIPDPPVAGAMRWLVEMEFTDGFQVVIYSGRSRTKMGIEAMKDWIKLHIQEACMGDHAHARTVNNLVFTNTKPPAFLTLDDRAICFRGTFPSIQELENFRPWYHHIKYPYDNGGETK